MAQKIKDRPPLKCKQCGQPWWIGKHQFGGIAVRPGEWWLPVTIYWEATCGCEDPFTHGPRAVRAESEWDLYKEIRPMTNGL